MFDIRLREVGTKIGLNGTSKLNRQTDRHTDTKTEGHLTYKKHWPRGPMLLKIKEKNISGICE